MPIDVNQVSSLTERVISQVEKAIVGKRSLLNKIAAAVLTTGGHILLEDFPGLAKTLIASSFATALGLDFKRIQFTPDLLPGDITGGYVVRRGQELDAESFEIRKGPIFAHIVLADEINRASPKTQSAMLEAMQERQVTLEGMTIRLPEPFLVIATQNPIEYEGTFPLPEAQLDRFILKLSVGYPGPEEEWEILKRRQERQIDEVALEQVTCAEELLEIRKIVEKVYVAPDTGRYIVDLVRETRRHRSVVVGSSPRGSLALLKLAKAWAAMQGREFVIPDDVKEFVEPALVHRLVLEPELWMDANATREILRLIQRSVPVPVLDKQKA